MESLLPQLQKLLTHENVKNNLEGTLKTIVDNPDSFNKRRYSQSILEQLILMAKTQTDYGPENSGHWANIHELATEHLDPTKGSRSMRLTSALRKKIKYIESQYENNESGKAADQTLQFLNLALLNVGAANPIWEIYFKSRNIFTKYFETPNNWAEPILQHWRDMMVKANFQSGTDLQSVVLKTNELVKRQNSNRKN